MTGSHKYRLLVAVCLTVLVIDHGTKFLAVEELTWAMTGLEDNSLGARVARFYATQHPQVRHRVVVVPSFFHLRYVENPGAAFGLFAGMPASQRIPLFVAVSIGATGFILWFYRRVPDGHAALRWGLALVLGGALGNFIDRMARNYVIDFIDWHWRNKPGLHWPTFNLADTAISCGVMLLVYEMFRNREQQPAVGTSAQPQASGAAAGTIGDAEPFPMGHFPYALAATPGDADGATPPNHAGAAAVAPHPAMAVDSSASGVDQPLAIDSPASPTDTHVDHGGGFDSGGGDGGDP